jgi:hypothetical protein
VLADARASINGGAVRPNADGTVTIVVAREQLAHPNAITTAGHPHGTIAFRWFLSDAVPDKPAVALLKTTDVALRPT